MIIALLLAALLVALDRLFGWETLYVEKRTLLNTHSKNLVVPNYARIACVCMTMLVLSHKRVLFAIKTFFTLILEY